MIRAGREEAYKIKDLLRSKGIPVILRPMLSLPPEEDDPYDRSLSQPAELAAAGVKFAFASFDNSFAQRLGQNAANVVAYGVPVEGALNAVTIYPARRDYRSVEHTSQLPSRPYLVCRPLLHNNNT